MKIKGYCCSQLVVAGTGIDPSGEGYDVLMRSLRGLCVGMFGKKTCGALTGGACALALYLDGADLAETCRRLAEWFESRFGGIECKDLNGAADVPTMICMDIVRETCAQCVDMLTDYDCL